MPAGLRDISPVVAIVQARLGSTRLPQKVMRDICGRPMLWHVVNRARMAALVDTVVVATTTEKADDAIEKWCGDNALLCFRGSLNDVLERYYGAAKEYGAKTIVRITSDCPLLDPSLVDEIIRRFSEGGLDYVSVGPDHPDGLDAEVFSYEALKRAFDEATLSSEREHVTPYMWKNPGTFKISSVSCRKDLSHMRWTVDDERDYKFVKAVYEGLGCPEKAFYLNDILGFLEKNTELLKINSGTKRNEGYAKSVKEDKAVKT
ncbi:MAG: glycosyltransferase family protein [Deltaproteobacteria bacterium]